MNENPRHAWPSPFVWGLIFVLMPFALKGQQPGAAMDSWRTAFSQKLDQQISNLNQPTFRNPVAAASLNPKALGGPIAQAPLESMIDGLLGRQGLPIRLSSVVSVESGFNPAALSPKGALGLWQLMPDTARHYGLAVDAREDERLDPVKATMAAAAYLRDLYARFGDWPLALAAYNAGENRVRQAMNRLKTDDFWTLSREQALPQETLQYVRKVLSFAGGDMKDQRASDRGIRDTRIVFAALSFESAVASDVLSDQDK